MYILYDFVCYDLFYILLSCDKIMDPWNVYMYVCSELLQHIGRSTRWHVPEGLNLHNHNYGNLKSCKLQAK
jgi:hypothetical protein